MRLAALAQGPRHPLVALYARLCDQMAELTLALLAIDELRAERLRLRVEENMHDARLQKLDTVRVDASAVAVRYIAGDSDSDDGSGDDSAGGGARGGPRTELRATSAQAAVAEARAAAETSLVASLAAQGDVDDAVAARRRALAGDFAALTATAELIKRLPCDLARPQQAAVQRAIHRAAAAFVVHHKFPFLGSCE